MNSILTKQGFADFVGGQFFTVCFTKVDGTERILNGRLGVSKHVRGTGNHKQSETLLVVWDCQKREYRSFHIFSVKYIKAHGMVLDLAEMQIKREMVKAQNIAQIEIRKAA